nr:hypothetical protein [Candidatus Nitrosarchaeum limnium]
MSLSSNNELIASCNDCGSFGGTRIPVSLFLIISGMSPTLVAITGIFKKMPP